MTPVICRSYSALTFDGCPTCVDAALAATGQAAVYVLGRTAPGLSRQGEVPVEFSYLLRVRLTTDIGDLIGTDDLEVSQSVEAVPVADESASCTRCGGADESLTGADDELESGMKLEDFQTVIDRLELSPAGRRGLCGSIGGALYAFERFVGRFDVDIVPGR